MQLLRGQVYSVLKQSHDQNSQSLRHSWGWCVWCPKRWWGRTTWRVARWGSMGIVTVMVGIMASLIDTYHC